MFESGFSDKTSEQISVGGVVGGLSEITLIKLPYDGINLNETI
ncbi:MAG: hypothetical protein PHX18_00935 [Candidatus Gastranaerophilales bacterium]|nr:hypothetical protein [Candidatus Gastranaerophilales bacterium]